MLTFREARKRCRVRGFQCHHLIPLEVTENRAFATLFDAARLAGFDPNDFIRNGMHLPSSEAQATAFGLPLHRGNHPRYNEVVAARVALLVDMPMQFGVPGLLNLPRLLKDALRMRQCRLFNDHRNPFRSAVDFRRLDGEVELLWQRTVKIAGCEQQSPKPWGRADA